MPIDPAANRPSFPTANVRPIPAPVVAEETKPTEVSGGVVKDLFEAARGLGSRTRIQVVERALTLLFARFGLRLPTDGNVNQFWRDVEKASVTPFDANDPRKGTQLHALTKGMATLVVSQRPELVNAPPNAGEAAAEGLAKMLNTTLMAEAHRALHEGFPTWEQMNKSIADEVAASHGGTQPTSVSDPAFFQELEKLGGGVILDDTNISVLGRDSNDAALQERLKVIANATESIDCAVWKIYGDESGEAFVSALESKVAQTPSLRARVVVDGNVAEKDPKSMALLKRLEDAGVEVMRYHDTQHPANGMHWKALIADGQVAVAGGRNVGNDYLHGGRWRDTDVRIEGRGVLGLSAQFADVWNKGAAASGQAPISKLTPAAMKSASSSVDSNGRIMTVVDLPGPKNPQAVAKTLLKSIQGAQKEINIEQGYFLEVPVMLEALEERAKAGVEINILANSKESNDVPGLDLMGRATLARMAALPNVHVFTQRSRKGEDGKPLSTLHSKWMTVDGTLAAVGSWNQHGRSMFLEAEGMSFFDDPTAIAQLNDELKADIADARKETKETLQPTPEQQKLVDLLETLGVAYI
ncbi:MAG: phospholipase D-like domain-containing protein [Myxococcaceae bacterium]